MTTTNPIPSNLPTVATTQPLCASPDTLPSQAYSSRELLLAILLAVAPVVAIFGPLLLVDRSFATRDAAHFYHPLLEWISKEWAAGRVPLWNVYENGGTAIVADATSSIFYPGKLLFALPIDFATRYKLYVIAHLLLASISTWWLARRWHASPAASAMAAMAYSAGGNVLFQYANVVFLVGASWVPLGLAALEGIIQRRSLRSACLLAIVLAMTVLGGDPQTAYHLMLIGGVWIATKFMGTLWNSPSSTEHPSSTNLRATLVSLLLLGSASALAGLISAIQVLPSSEITKISERAAFHRPRNIYEAASILTTSPTPTLEQLADVNYKTPRARTYQGLFGPPDTNAHHDIVYDFSIAPWRVIEFLWPSISGKPFPTNGRWTTYKLVEGRIWTPTMYLGLIPFLLGAVAFAIRSSDSRVRWLSWILAWFFVASFGLYGIGYLLQSLVTMASGKGSTLGIGAPVGGLYWLMVTLLPTYIYFRYPAKLMVFAVLAISLLAGISADQLLSQPRPRLRRFLQGLAILSFAIAVIMLLAGSTLLHAMRYTDGSAGPFDLFGCKLTIILSALQTGIIAITAAALLGPKCTVSTCYKPWVVAIITAIDLYTANSWLLQTADASIWRKEPLAATIIRTDRQSTTTANNQEASDTQATPPTRVYRGRFAGWRPEHFRTTGSTQRSEETTLWECDTLFPKFMFQGDISLCESYGSIKLLDYQSLLLVARTYGPRQPDGYTLPHPVALRLLGCEYLVIPDTYDPSKFATRVESPLDPPPGTAIWKLNTTLPRCWVVHHIEQLPPLADPLDLAAADQRSRDVLFPGNRIRDFRHQATIELAQELPYPELTTPLPEASAREHQSVATITSYEPQAMEIKANLERPGLVILSDLYEKNWRAMRQLPSGEEVPLEIWPVNRVLRGVFLPAGEHTITMRYEPTSFYRGAWLSLAGTILTIAAGVYLIRRRHTESGPTKSDS